MEYELAPEEIDDIYAAEESVQTSITDFMSAASEATVAKVRRLQAEQVSMPKRYGKVRDGRMLTSQTPEQVRLKLDGILARIISESDKDYINLTPYADQILALIQPSLDENGNNLRDVCKVCEANIRKQERERIMNLLEEAYPPIGTWPVWQALKEEK